MTAATCWLPSDEPSMRTKSPASGTASSGARPAEPPKPAADPGGVTLRGHTRFHAAATGADPAPAAGAGDASLARDAGRREAVRPSFPAPTCSPSKASSRRAPARAEPVPRAPSRASASGAAAGPKSWWQRLSDGMRRTSSSLGGEHHRPVHQAQARRRDPGGARGRADPGRSRHRDRDAHHRRRSATAATTRRSRPTR